jgi:hypothetical protein
VCCGTALLFIIVVGSCASDHYSFPICDRLMSTQRGFEPLQRRIFLYAASPRPAGCRGFCLRGNATGVSAGRCVPVALHGQLNVSLSYLRFIYVYCY